MEGPIRGLMVYSMFFPFYEIDNYCGSQYFLARWESCRIGHMWNVKCGNFVLLTGLVTKIGHRREFKS